ncbi:signal peptidase I [Candidatus Omnitrophota bacterium]
MKNLKEFLHYFFLNPKQYNLTNLIIIATLLVLGQATIMSVHKVVSESMEDTLLVGDTLLVFKTWYGFRPPFFERPITPGFRLQYGDIIICKYPGDPTKDYVKRCVAKGGDTVSVDKKQLYVNDYPIPLPQGAKHTDPEILHRDNARRDYYPQRTVPRDSLFVLGDHRDFSFDSRTWGCLPRKNLRGKVGYILWSLDPEIPWSDFRNKVRKGRFFKRVY